MVTKLKYQYLAVTLPAILLLSSCATAPQYSFSDTSSLTIGFAASLDSQAPAVIDELLQAVSEQNAVAFAAPSSVVDSTQMDELSSGSGNGTKPEFLGESKKTKEFEKRLKLKAKNSYVAQQGYLVDLQAALDGAGLEVTEVVLSVQSHEVDAKTGVLTTNVHIARHLSSGVTWEEIIPFVTEIEASTGSILSLEVQDDSWRNESDRPIEDIVPLDQREVLGDGSDGTTPLAEPAVEETSFDDSWSIESGVYRESGLSIQTAALTSTQRSAVAAYAKKWWNGRNPVYTAITTDCTNFVSQAMYAGGWDQTSGYYNDPGAWWHKDPSAYIPKSYSWGNAPDFYNFARNVAARVTRYSSVYSVRVGDLLMYDTGASGMNHAMVVTSVASGGPYLTYHTTDTLNKPFSTIAVALQNSNPIWFALKV